MERNVFAKKKKKDSFAKFSYEKQYFWKNRLLAFEGKNGRYTSTRNIYTYTSLAKEEGTNFVQPSSSFFNQLFRLLFSTQHS